MNTQPTESREPRWSPSSALSIALVVVAAIAVYANTLANGFAYDDDWIILRNDRVKQLDDLGLIWGTPYWPTFGHILGLYRPLAIFAYALQWAASDGQPWFFHGVSTLLHAIASLLVLLILRRFMNARAALVGGLIFAVHPLHTEAVANIVGQAELIAAVGVLLACWLYLRAENRIGWWLYLAIPACYLMALFSKEAAITFPALLVVLDAARGRLSNKQALRSYAEQTWLLMFVLAATAILYLAIRVDVLGSISGSDAAPGLPFLREDRRILTAFRAWPEYLRLLFFPKDLSADYAPAVILPVESLTPMALIGALFLILTAVIALLTPKHPHAGLPAGWFLISIFTVSNLVFPVGVVVAERTLYTPSVAVAFIAGFIWMWIERNRRYLKAGYAAVALVIGLMSYRTIIRNPEWRSTIALLNSVVRDHPESYHTAWLLADQYWRRGDIPRSRYYWEAAMLLWPRDSQLLNEFGNFNIGQKNWKRAIELLEQSRDMHPWVPHTQELLAFSYAHAGRSQDAIATGSEAVKVGGRIALIQAIRAKAYEQMGDYGAASGAWRASVSHKGGGLWIYRAMLARALARYGDRTAALAAVDTASRGLATDSVAIRTLASVRTAIEAGCYSEASKCADPIADWGLTIDPPAALGTASSQNATQNSAVRQ